MVSPAFVSLVVDWKPSPVELAHELSGALGFLVSLHFPAEV